MLSENYLCSQTCQLKTMANTIKKTLTVLLLVAVATVAFAQKIPQRLEIASVDLEVVGIEEHLDVFNMPEENGNHYYLSVGHLGIGNNIIQLDFDPLYELFFHIGDSLDEAIEALEQLKGLFKAEKGTQIEMQGCLAIGFPNDKVEKVNVTYQKIIFTKVLEFSIDREEYTRATHSPKSEFNSLVSGVKFYKKLHPSE